jgi:antitoxin component of MazEF toxin-antitoxin module
MVSRVLKKFGNSRCLPLDKTLLEILGIDYENAQVTISIEQNKLIISKAPGQSELTQFVLNNEQWEKFNKALEEKPKSLSSMHNLLSEPGIFDD